VELENGKYIQHRILVRPWGWECQFTVDLDGRYIDEVLPIDSKADEKAISQAIDDRLLEIKNRLQDAAQEVPERIYTEKEIVSLLVSKELLTEDQSLSDLRSKSEITAEAKG